MSKLNNNGETAVEKGLQEQIAEKIAEIAAVADQLPDIVIIHDISSMATKYMSRRGLQILGLELEELLAMGPEYHVRYFNQTDTKDYAPVIFGLLERNLPDETISFFQQVRPSIEHPWVWYLCAMKILLRDAEGRPVLTIALVSEANPEQCETAQVKRLQEERAFVRENMAKFIALSAKEKELLSEEVLGRSAAEAAVKLEISLAAVERQRKRIRKKLQTNSFAVLCQYAELFGLV